MNYWQDSPQNIYVAAHRGWSRKYPENTMASFRAACTLDVDQVETDVRVTSDGELVLIHDASVDRTTNGTGLVCEKTFEEIRSLDAGSWKGEEFAGEKIPTFIEFMDYIKQFDTLTLDIELKEYPTEGREELSYDVCDRTLKIIDDYGFSDRVVINTFSGQLHEYINDKYGSKYRQHVYFPITHLTGKMTRNPYEYAYCCCMFKSMYSKINMAEKMDFERMAAVGPKPWAGSSVRDEESVDLAIKNGATLITCNNPDEILNILKSKGYHK